MRARVAVSTMLTCYERQRLDAVGLGLYEPLHRDSIDEVVRDVRDRGVATVVVSVARCGAEEARWVGHMMRERPRLRTVAVLTEVDRRAPHAVLSLGHCGVRHLIDARQPDGWQTLRNALLSDDPDDVHRVAMATLAVDLAPESAPGVAPGASAGMRTGEAWHFFETLFSVPPCVRTVAELTRVLQVAQTTFMSRFYRLGLPRPKQYLAMARLTRAARLFEDPSMSVARVAYCLEYSSPQSFGRHLRSTLRLTPTEFRKAYDSDRMLQLFRQRLVLPYLDRFRKFPVLPRRLTRSPGAKA
jgi:AraC-like DNA-binding protein